MNELPQSLDDVDVLSRPGNHQFRTFVQAVVQYFQALKYVSPVLALVVQSLIKHVHYFIKVGGAVAEEINVSTWNGKMPSRVIRDSLSRSLTTSVLAYLLNVILAMSAMSVPVGPHGSLLVAVMRNQLPVANRECLRTGYGDFDIPFRTLTWTDE